MSQDIAVKIEHFFEQLAVTDKLDISVVRQDGIQLYSSHKDKLDATSIGALAGGVWQAAESLMALSGGSKLDEHRLSFDTSSSGVYILTLKAQREKLYLVGIYKDSLNPAILKQKLRVLHFRLEEYLNADIEEINNRNGFLFENITDEEMDNLFSF